MGVLIPLLTQAIHTERTTVAYLAVETVPDAALQLRVAVDLDVNASPGEHLALPLTRDQADELLYALAARLGRRVIGVRW
ncbi:hypothetical protein OG618_15530 [Kitasatospora sp. NBC_01246]|uniref:hypothetical protein n=1 Tax=Kitasatospora sp. NBC_01246 TaxID=2903570 RepID=UPI002E34A964|nr:hypothetical protein [Kitasatospora sp. NBC_01246]